MTRRSDRIAAVLALSLLSGVASGQEGLHAEGGLITYSNTDRLQVLSPWLSGAYQLSERWRVDARYQADVISAASVDIVTAATRPFEETRHEVGAGAALEVGVVRANLGAIGSFESDTYSETAFAGAEIDLFSRNLTLGAGYGLSLTQLGTALEPFELWRSRTVHQIDLSAAQVLSPSTVATAGYTLQARSGLLSSPYQHVPLFPRDQALWRRENAQWVAERHPDRHLRHALSLGLRHALWPKVFGRAGWRGYVDTWAMRAHSGELGVDLDLGSGLLLELRDRVHWQSSASFYRSIYTVSREYLTRDRKLAEMITNIAHLAVRPKTGPFELLAGVELHYTHYDDHYGLVGDSLVRTPDVWAGLIRVGAAYEP